MVLKTHVLRKKHDYSKLVWEKPFYARENHTFLWILNPFLLDQLFGGVLETLKEILQASLSSLSSVFLFNINDCCHLLRNHSVHGSEKYIMIKLL